MVREDSTVETYDIEGEKLSIHSKIMDFTEGCDDEPVDPALEEIYDLMDETSAALDEAVKSKQLEKCRKFVFEKHGVDIFEVEEEEQETLVNDYILSREIKANGPLAIQRCQVENPYLPWSGPPPLSVKTPLSLLEAETPSHYEATILAVQNQNTKQARDSDLRYWGAWISAWGLIPRKEEDISENWICEFIVQHIKGFEGEEAERVDQRLVEGFYKSKPGPHSIATVQRRLTSLNYWFKKRGVPSSVKTDLVRDLMKSLCKVYGSPKLKKAITRPILFRMLDQIKGDTPKDLRDRALLTFLWGSGGRRRSEAEHARIEDLEEREDEFIFHLRESKTSKGKKAEPKPITGLAATFMKEWINTLTAQGSSNTGPLFRPIAKSGVIKESRLKGTFINRLIKGVLEKAGYDPKEFSSHSMRSGFVTQAANEGCSLPEIKNLTGHRSDAMISHYYRQGNVLRSKAGNLLQI